MCLQSSLVPRPPPRLYLAAVEKSCEIKSGQRPGNEAIYKVHHWFLAGTKQVTHSKDSQAGTSIRAYWCYISLAAKGACRSLQSALVRGTEWGTYFSLFMSHPGMLIGITIWHYLVIFPQRNYRQNEWWIQIVSSSKWSSMPWHYWNML